jgi:UDP-GlcNAc:undecaprenyl-phosphate GlcNAc-1-phosphate transferase
MNYFFIIAISFCIVFLLTPSIRFVALRFSVIDKRNHRKIHNKLIAKMGGLAIYLGFLGGIGTIALLDSFILKSNFSLIASLMMGSTLILFLGIYDDFQGSGALLKLLVQLIISMLMIKAGFLFKGFYISGIIDISFGNFSIPMTLLWLVGITNAVNLIDGLDGLASGVIGIALIFIALYGLLFQDIFISYIALALAGATLAFLKYNFFPAKIFMGDTGSLFLGFIVACLGIYRSNAQDHNLYFFPISILLLFPICDSTFAIIRRLKNKKNIFQGDKSHMHHYLIKHGFSQSQAVKIFYFVTIALGVFSLALLFFSM